MSIDFGAILETAVGAAADAVKNTAPQVEDFLREIARGHGKTDDEGKLAAGSELVQRMGTPSMVLPAGDHVKASQRVAFGFDVAVQLSDEAALAFLVHQRDRVHHAFECRPRHDRIVTRPFPGDELVRQVRHQDRDPFAV